MIRSLANSRYHKGTNGKTSLYIKCYAGRAHNGIACRDGSGDSWNLPAAGYSVCDDHASYSRGPFTTVN